MKQNRRFAESEGVEPASHSKQSARSSHRPSQGQPECCALDINGVEEGGEEREGVLEAGMSSFAQAPWQWA